MIHCTKGAFHRRKTEMDCSTPNILLILLFNLLLLLFCYFVLMFYGIIRDIIVD